MSKELRSEFVKIEISNINFGEEEGISLGELAKLCCGYELIISSNELVWKGVDNKFDFSLKIKSLIK